MAREIGDFDCYSDVYKSVYGIRPRHNPEWKTEADYHADMASLQEEIDEQEAEERQAPSPAYVPQPAPAATFADLWPA